MLAGLLQELINISKPLRGLFICFGAICLFAILQKSGHFEPPYYLQKYSTNLGLYYLPQIFLSLE